MNFPCLIYKNKPGVIPTMGDWFNTDDLENEIARNVVQIFKDMSLITTKGRKYNLTAFLRYAQEIYITSNYSDRSGENNPHGRNKAVDIYIYPTWCMPPIAALLHLTTDYNILLGTLKYDDSGRKNLHIHIDEDFSYARNFIGVEMPKKQPNGTIGVESYRLVDKDSIYDPLINKLYAVPSLFLMAGAFSIFTGDPWEQTRDILTHGVPLTEKEPVKPDFPDIGAAIVKYALIGLSLYIGYRAVKAGALDRFFKPKKKQIKTAKDAD